MICRERLNPMPLPVALVVKKGTKIIIVTLLMHNEHVIAILHYNF